MLNKLCENKQSLKYIKNQFGFTLVEFVVVVTVIAIMTGAVGLSVKEANEDIRLSNALLQAQADMRYALETAMSQNRTVFITISVGGNNYKAQFSDDNSYLQSPVTGGNLDVDLPDGVSITSTGLSGTLTFDTDGLPRISGSTFSGSVSIMKLNNVKFLSVYSSGYICLEDAVGSRPGCGGC